MEYLPAFAPEMLVLSAAALVAFHCSRTKADITKQAAALPARERPELKRSGSSSSIGSGSVSSTTRKAGVSAKQVHRAYHSGDSAVVLKVWQEVLEQQKGKADGVAEGAQLELPALKLVVKAMLDSSDGLTTKQINEIATYIDDAGVEGGKARCACGLLQACTNWQGTHTSLAGLNSLQPLADALGLGKPKNEEKVQTVRNMIACYATHGRQAEVDALLDGAPGSCYEEAVSGYLKAKGEARLTIAMDIVRRLRSTGAVVSPSCLTSLFESARDSQVVQLFAEAGGWGPFPQQVLEVVARQAFESGNVELGQQVAEHLRRPASRASAGAYLSLVRLCLNQDDGQEAAKLFAEMADSFTVTARTCTLLLRVESCPSSRMDQLPVAFLDAVLSHCRARHYFDLPASRGRYDTSETANLYAAAMLALARVPERLHMAVALDNQLSMLGLDRDVRRKDLATPQQQKATSPRSQAAEDIARSDCVMTARRVLLVARGLNPPGL